MNQTHAVNAKLLKAMTQSQLNVKLSADEYRQRCMLLMPNCCSPIKPLVSSSQLPLREGKLTVFSQHRHTINLINQQQQLITLHRYGSGFAPMGRVLKTADFDTVQAALTTDSHLTINQTINGELKIGHISIDQASHICDLELKPDPALSFDKKGVAQLLQQINNSTGVHGQLGNLILTPYQAELENLCLQLSNLLAGNRADLTPYIGLGVGLTPSYDDIIVGILAVLACDERFYAPLKRLHDAMQSMPLDKLTTTISATFLQYALKRQFSLLVMQVVRALAQGKYHHVSIHKLLNYGHTSGADLLLGIWLGIDRFIIRD